MSFTKATGKIEDRSLKKPRTTWFITSIFTSSQLATGSTWVQPWGEKSYWGTEGGGSYWWAGVTMVGCDKQVLRKPDFINAPHRTTFLQAPFPMETKFI